MMIRALAWILLSCQAALVALGDPLLKVPKVYNALITTDQNLAPSRAIPVIQPVIHRTAIGYSPPFYYQPGAPGYGAGYVPSYEPNYEPGIYNSGGPDQSESPSPDVSDTSNPDVESVDVDQERREGEGKEENDYDDRCKEVGRKTKGQVPLNFYPNFRSVYYDPYLYGFNAYPAFPTPGNYYLNYQPQGFPSPGPQGMPPPPGYQPGYSGPERPQNPQSKDDKREETKAEGKSERIPDVPPPPVPARRTVSKNH
ncbi:uncharacterized protein LOC107038195 [Diachasma alloeum]|uniref:uncharacterized protein LOC107038195 n=1 Tax=Diachasma alloeum TaxID=454923 RepID=UPI000738181C|nr:uncharacterized protein LOC107038195 [Diachasma alloeum]